MITSFFPLAVVAGLLTSAYAAEPDCARFAPFGQPVHRSLAADLAVGAPPDWSVVCDTGHVAAFNSVRHVSDWVAFRLRRMDLLQPVAERKDSFRGDARIGEQHRVVTSDYTRSGFDRGHLAPAAAMKWSRDAMRESFLMTNIAPQVGPGFNQHIWKALERKMRLWACMRGTLHVTTGPLYEARPVRRISYDKDGDGIDDNGILVDVPTHFFKLAVDPARMESIAFILPNKRLSTKDLWKYLVSIDEVEARSRLDFLTGLWDGVEQAVESHVQPHLWDEPEETLCRAIQ